jgi:hypothetical protein
MLARGIRLNAHLSTSLVNAYRSVPFKAGDVAEHCKQQALAIMRQLQADKLANINAFTAVIALHIDFADMPGERLLQAHAWGAVLCPLCCGCGVLCNAARQLLPCRRNSPTQLHACHTSRP